jgi:Domain of unknown function (DUF4129)
VRLRFDLKLLLAVLVTLPCVAQPGVEPAGAMPPRDEVQKALDKVGNDPDLTPERTVNMLRWAEAEPGTDEPWWWQWVEALVRWFQGLFNWLAESGRYVVWVIGAFLAGLLLFYLVRLVRRRGLPSVPQRFTPPSHVRDLDIRPESLPDDIGAAAFALWQRGEQRAALALLYRGLLSRLVHAHGVPIRGSSTEGECLALARPRLKAPGADFVSRLISTWAAAVYGGSQPATGTVQTLCAEFAPALDAGSGTAA